MNNLRLRPTLDIGMLAYWFIPIVGGIYAAGFLVVFTFSKDYGINGTELLEARYIQVGSLFFMACLVCLLPVFWLLFGYLRIQRLIAESEPANEESSNKVNSQTPEAGELQKRDKPPQKPSSFWAFVGLVTLPGTEWLPRLPGTFTYSAMILTFYIVLAFTERSFFLNHSGRILFNFFPPLAASLASFIQHAWTRRKAVSDPKAGYLTVKGVDLFMALLQIVIAGFALYFMYQTIFQDHLPEDLKLMFWRDGRLTGAFGFVLFIILIALYVFFAARFRTPETSATSKIAVTFSCLCVVGMLSYMSILTFAYAIYPFIPSSRGGGYYIDTVHVKLSFKRDEVPAEDIKQIQSEQSKFIILDQNSDLIFVASTDEADGPDGWRVPDAKNEIRRPNIHEIRRNVLVSVTYLNQKTN